MLNLESMLEGTFGPLRGISELLSPSVHFAISKTTFEIAALAQIDNAKLSKSPVSTAQLHASN